MGRKQQAGWQVSKQVARELPHKGSSRYFGAQYPPTLLRARPLARCLLLHCHSEGKVPRQPKALRCLVQCQSCPAPGPTPLANCWPAHSQISTPLSPLRTLQISVLPRCSGVAEVLDAHTLREAAALFFRAGAATMATILTESYISLATLLFVFAVLFGLCRSGGIGALPGEPGWRWQHCGWAGRQRAVGAVFWGWVAWAGDFERTIPCLVYCCNQGRPD